MATANVTGLTAGSTLAAASSDGTALAVTRLTSTTATVAGTFTAAGTPSITLVETLAGAVNSPNPTVVGVTVTGGTIPGDDGSPYDEAVIYPLNTTARSTYVFTDQGLALSHPSWAGSDLAPYKPCAVSVTASAVWQGVNIQHLCYYSTDHSTGGGGIGVMCCRGDPAVPASWKDYDAAKSAGWFTGWTGGTLPTGNPIFTIGSQTELPWVNIIDDGSFVLTFSPSTFTGSRNQPTCRTWSADGLTGWATTDMILNMQVTDGIGNGISEYFKWYRNPFTGIPYTWVGYSLTAQYGTNDPKLGAWTQTQRTLRQAGRLEEYGGANFVLASGTQDMKGAHISRQGVVMLGNLQDVTISGVNKGVSDIYEWVVDGVTGAEIIRKPIKVFSHDTGTPAIALQAADPTILVTNTARVIIYMGANAANTSDSLRILTSPRRNYANTWFDDFDTSIPSGLTSTVYDFTNASAVPAGITQFNTGTTGLVFDATNGLQVNPASTTGRALFYSNASFTPANLDFVEFYVSGQKSDTTNADRGLLMGVADAQVALGSISNAIGIVNFSLGTSTTPSNSFRVGQMAGGAATSNVTSTRHPGLGNASDSSGTNYRAQKLFGVRWWPQLGKAYMIAENALGNGVEIDTITLDSQFLPGGSAFYSPLYPVFGVFANSATTVFERVKKMSVRTHAYAGTPTLGPSSKTIKQNASGSIPIGGFSSGEIISSINNGGTVNGDNVSVTVPTTTVATTAYLITTSLGRTLTLTVTVQNITNFLLQSEALGTTPWVQTNSTVNNDSTTAPDGTVTAEKISETVTNSVSHRDVQTVNGITAGAAYTFSCYLKTGTSQYAALALYDGVSVTYAGIFDLTAGTYLGGQSGAVPTNATITADLNGFYRCTITANAGAGATLIQPQVVCKHTSTVNASETTGSATTNNIYAWGAQLTPGSSPGTYTKTTTAPA